MHATRSAYGGGRRSGLIAIDETLVRLAAFDQRKSQVVELRFFGGPSVEETAEALTISPETVMGRKSPRRGCSVSWIQRARVDIDRWRRVEEVFHEALSLVPIQRVRLLDTSCAGDPALRAEVDSLLAYETSSGAFIEAPALDVAGRLMAADPSCRDRSLSGTTISHFRVLDKIGQGGMGVVYEAIDTRLGGKVALKFLPAHVVSNPQILQRFEREAAECAEPP